MASNKLKFGVFLVAGGTAAAVTANYFGAFDKVEAGRPYVNELAKQTDRAGNTNGFSLGDFNTDTKIDDHNRKTDRKAEVSIAISKMIAKMEGGATNYNKALATCALAGANDLLNDPESGKARKAVYNTFEGGFSFENPKHTIPAGLVANCLTIDQELLPHDAIVPLPEPPKN